MVFSNVILQIRQLNCSKSFNNFFTIHWFKDQWEIAQEKRKSDLEKKYQENVAEFGLGHRTASEVLNQKQFNIQIGFFFHITDNDDVFNEEIEMI